MANQPRTPLGGPAIIRWSPAIFWVSATALILGALSAIDPVPRPTLDGAAASVRRALQEQTPLFAAALAIAAAALAGTLIQRKRHLQRLGLTGKPLAQLASDIATVGAAGLTPKGSGTAGAVAALPAGWVLALVDWPVRAAVLAALTALATYATARYLEHAARAAERGGGPAHLDPGEVVVDEYVGVLLALAFVPWEPVWAAAAFLLFRAFDIVKPGPVGWADRNLHGAAGVMFDDVIAGLMAGAALAGVRAITLPG